METGVYLIKNMLDGKRYVGSTSESFKSRFYRHKLHLNKGEHCNKYLQRAFNKYGEENFEFVPIEFCKKEDCIIVEQYWINHFNSFKKRNGYNLLRFANSLMGFKHSKKTKKILSDKNKLRKNRKVTDDTKLKISKTLKGKKLSQERKNKIKIAHIKNRRVVLKFTKDNIFLEEFESISEATRRSKISSGSISNACVNRAKTAGGFIWKFKLG